MKKWISILSFSLLLGLLSACDKSDHSSSQQSAAEETTLHKMEKAYDKGYWEGFKKNFRESFIQSCLTSFPSEIKEAKKICECSADKSLSVLKVEDIEKLEKDDPELTMKLEKASESCMPQ